MSKEKFKDIHEEIGSYDIKAVREKLFPGEPAPLKEEYLPTGIDEGATFACASDYLPKEQLEKALSRQREYYLPFFEDHAPAMEDTRTHKELVEFQWRVATDEDKADFSRVLDGLGEWETVKIPHFGPPLGYAITYYRTTFELTENELTKDAQWICFNGVDYKAHVFINGTLVGSHEGFFAPFEFDYTKQAKVGSNVCVVVVENDFIPMGSSCEYWGVQYTGDKVYAQTGMRWSIYFCKET